MLTLSRDVQESIVVVGPGGDLLEICVQQIKAGRVRLAFTTPPEYTICRAEVYRSQKSGRAVDECSSRLLSKCPTCQHVRVELRKDGLAFCRACDALFDPSVQ
jgi:carbon storage regulator CsrA